jgi:hypothetical protein
MECVYWAVRTESACIIQVNFRLQSVTEHEFFPKKYNIPMKVIVIFYASVHIMNGYESMHMEYVQPILCLLQHEPMSDQSGKAALLLCITEVFSK